MGETTPVATPPRPPGYFGPDESEAFLSLHIARPLLGQRVLDLLQTLRILDGGNGIRLVGVGVGGPIALHAAALDDRVKAVEVEGSALSWSDVTRAGLSRDQFSAVIPGVLESYDLPELAPLIAPRPLSILRPTRPDGSPASPEALKASYAVETAAYRGLGADNRLILRAGP